MRTAFIRTLVQLAERERRITLITGDLGFGVVEEFARRFPQQFLNAGVAEQNMTGVAAGMALSGRIVFTYSIANFPTIRCLEQIRNDVCYHNANVKVVAVGGGFSYGSLGMSHHATEDLALLRALPNMTVIAPGDPAETDAAVKAVVGRRGPCYLRLGRAGEPAVHTTPFRYEVGRALLLLDGPDLTLMSTGGMLQTTVAVAARLAKEGVRARVLSMHTLKPLDTDAVTAAAQETRGIMTIEEHSIQGGLGGAVAEVLAEAGSPVPFKRIGVTSPFSSQTGSQQYLRELHGLSEDRIYDAVRLFLDRLQVTSEIA
jgi:transketolase